VASAYIAVSLMVAIVLGPATSRTQNQAVPPPAASAEAVMTAALKTAKADGRVVLIEFGASWCSWCTRFNAFVNSPDVSNIVAANYVVVNLTVQETAAKKALENPGAEALMDRWGGANSGLPFYVFLDGSGRKIADSNVMPDGSNLGFPGNPKEQDLFVALLDRTAPKLTPAHRTRVVDYLTRTVPRQ
jgi:thiol:disulfide interchange protein